MNAIFTKVLYEKEEKRDVILCTIIDNSGSTPRKQGAQMLVGEKGIIAGTIGGGSAEGETISRCKELLAEKKSDIHEYIMRHNDKEDIGMVCGGNITVHMQYIAHDDEVWSSTASEVLRKIAVREPGVLVLDLKGGAPEIADSAKSDAEHFCVLLPIGERAVIFGAGHCSLALAPLLATLGFRVTVMDDRAELVTKERFPQADKLICGDFKKMGDYLQIGEDDYTVVITSGHASDYVIEAQLLKGPFAYLGVIGSKTKIAAVNKMLREDGVSEEALAKVHTPIGIQIKAVTPAEIAVSIAGEMILERAKKREEGGVFLHGCPMR